MIFKFRKADGMLPGKVIAAPRFLHF